MATDDHWQIIRNRFHVYGNPIGAQKMERVLDLLALPPRPHVLDVGCGKGELVLRLVERFGARAVGIDPSPVLSLAREAAVRRTPGAGVTWHEARVQDVPLAPASFDLTASIGSSHAYGNHEATLAALSALTRPGGYVLAGEGFWMQTPDPAYLEALGDPDFTLLDNAGNLAAGEAHGLRPIYNTRSSREEWDNFEWLYEVAMDRHAREHGLSREQEEQVAASRSFRAAQERWGRDTMGFALYLFRKVASPQVA